MYRRGFTLFRLDRRAHRLCLASWHSPHSLTWRWLVNISLGGRLRPYFYNTKHNCGGGGCVRIFAVELSWQWQHPVWFRVLYMRLADERDQRSGMLWLNDKHPHKIPDPLPPIPRPTAAAPATLQ